MNITCHVTDLNDSTLLQSADSPVYLHTPSFTMGTLATTQENGYGPGLTPCVQHSRMHLFLAMYNQSVGRRYM